jgi:hypothetical protein
MNDESTGGYLGRFASVPASLDGVEFSTIREILQRAIAKYVDPSAAQVPPDDVNCKVVDRLFETIDRYGLGSSELVDFVAKNQSAGTIRAGFYRICKDLAIKYAEGPMAQASDDLAAAFWRRRSAEDTERDPRFIAHKCGFDLPMTLHVAR